MEIMPIADGKEIAVRQVTPMMCERFKLSDEEALNTIDTAATRARAIERKLRDVQELPASDASAVLLLEGVDGNGEVEEGRKEPA